MSQDTYEMKKSTVLSEAIPIVIFIVLMALASKVAIPLPFTPVPLTLQVFLVILSGLVLGAKKAGTAQAIFLLAILIGMPLTASGLAGPAAFVGPTAGYLLGFLPAAYLVGLISEKNRDKAAPFYAGLIGIVVIYLLGTTWLTVYLNDFHKAFTAGVLPFIGFDIAKAISAIAASKGLHGFGNIR